MKDKKEQLIANVKFAVQRFGMSGITVRNISEVSGVNDSHLHRFFNNKEELLLAAYERESNELFIRLMNGLDETADIPLDFKAKVRLHFHRIWNDLISDAARLSFCVYYYHSTDFSMAESVHNKQINALCDRLQKYFESREACINALYSLYALVYDKAKILVDSGKPNTPELEELEFRAYYALLCSYLPAKIKT